MSNRFLPTTVTHKPKHSKKTASFITPKTVSCTVVILGFLYVCYVFWPSGKTGQIGSFLPSRYAQKRSSVNDPTLAKKLDKLRIGEPNVGITTAYYGEQYEVMGILSDVTKQKYADLYGYTFYVDNHLFRKDMSWNEKSAIRTLSIRAHLSDHDWIYWTDSEVFIVNPKKRLSELCDDNFDVIMSKDWGGRQLNPGSILIRNSPTAIEILNAWEYFIAVKPHHDDLRGFEDIIKERPDLAARVKWVHQKELNGYPDVELRDKSYAMDFSAGHHYFEEGDFVVHVVNCLRDWNKDPICCHGIGVYYFYLFETAYDALIESL